MPLMDQPSTDVIQDTLDLPRLERSGHANAKWRRPENARRAKYYSLTRAGRKQLELEADEWMRKAAAVARLLKAEG